MAAVAVAFGLLAVWVMYLRPGSRLHRALALLLFARGLLALLRWLDSRFLTLEDRLATYLVIAIPFAAMNLAYLYWRRRQTGPPRRVERFVVRSTILVLFLAAETAYLLDHSLYLDADLNDGPLGLFFSAGLSSFALVGLAASLVWRKAAPGPLRQGHFVLALAFLVEPAFETGLRILVWASNPMPTVWLAIADLGLRFAMALCVFTALGIFAAAGTRAMGAHPLRATSEERTASLLLGSALVTGVAMFVAFRVLPRAMSGPLLWIMTAFWLLAMALGLTYAIVRYRVLESDRMMRFAVRQSTFAAIMGVIFVVTSETLELLIDASDGTIALAIAVGLAGLFRMLQRASGMLVQRVWPESDEAASGAVKRQAVYEAALEGILVDGAVTKKERMVLDALVEKLDLPAEEARRLEEEVLVRLAGHA